MRDESLAENHKEDGGGKEKFEAEGDLFGVLVIVIVGSPVNFSQRNE